MQQKKTPQKSSYWNNEWSRYDEKVLSGYAQHQRQLMDAVGTFKYCSGDVHNNTDILTHTDLAGYSQVVVETLCGTPMTPAARVNNRNAASCWKVAQKLPTQRSNKYRQKTMLLRCNPRFARKDCRHLSSHSMAREKTSKSTAVFAAHSWDKSRIDRRS